MVYALVVKDLSVTKHGKPVAHIAPVRPIGKGERVTPPLLRGKGHPGPRRPNTETPYDLVFDVEKDTTTN